MIVELTPNSLFDYGGISITFQRLAILNPKLLNTYFTANKNLILNDECITIVKRIRIKNKILDLDKYRKNREEERKNQVFVTSTSNINLNNYNDRQTREYICRTLLFGI